MSEYGVGGRTPLERRRLGAHPEKVSTPVNTGVVEFGIPVPQLPGRTPKRKLTDWEKGSGFFTDPTLKNPRKIELQPDPEKPVNYVKVSPGEFSTGPLNSDVEDHGGMLEGGAWVASPSKKLVVHGDSGFEGWIVEVDKDEDIRLLRMHGWWAESQMSKESRKAKKNPREAKPLKLRLH